MSDICGREYEVKQPTILPKVKYKHKPRARVLVEGITHRNGQLIRFKSRENAERHIRNMKLECA